MTVNQSMGIMFTFKASSELASSWQQLIQLSLIGERLYLSKRLHDVHIRFGVKPRLRHSSSLSLLESPKPN